jgi:hypothetical protein
VVKTVKIDNIDMVLMVQGQLNALFHPCLGFQKGNTALNRPSTINAMSILSIRTILTTAFIKTIPVIHATKTLYN